MQQLELVPVGQRWIDFRDPPAESCSCGTPYTRDFRFAIDPPTLERRAHRKIHLSDDVADESSDLARELGAASRLLAPDGCRPQCFFAAVPPWRERGACGCDCGDIYHGMAAIIGEAVVAGRRALIRVRKGASVLDVPVRSLSLFRHGSLQFVKWPVYKDEPQPS